LRISRANLASFQTHRICSNAQFSLKKPDAQPLLRAGRENLTGFEEFSENSKLALND
jgi:hypothetical protein